MQKIFEKLLIEILKTLDDQNASNAESTLREEILAGRNFGEWAPIRQFRFDFGEWPIFWWIF